jgi:hypothetical protein
MPFRHVANPLLVVTALWAAEVRTQCQGHWLPGLWMPNSSSPVGPTFNSTMWDPDGSGPAPEQLAVGSFASANAFPGLVAAWNPATDVWTIIGSTTSLLGSAIVHSMVAMANGDLVIGGYLQQIDGVSVSHIARYDGTSWHPLGAGSQGQVQAMTVLPNGTLVAHGSFDVGGGTIAQLAQWNGSAWSAFGPITTNMGVSTLNTLANGDVLAGGFFSNIGGAPASIVARYSGGSWTALGTGTAGNVYTALELANGELLIGGIIVLAGGTHTGVARWNGSGWSQMASAPQGTVESLIQRPNGHVIAAGTFSQGGQGVDPEYVARWDSTAWTHVTQGPGAGIDYRCYTLTNLPNGEFVVGGEMVHAGGNLSVRLARFSPACTAIADSYGAACPSSAGANTLTPITLPWAGTTFRARGEDLPTTALVVSVTGFSSTAVPMASVLPQGQLGCDLLASPDILSVGTSVVGGFDSHIALPNNPSIAGLQIYHQLALFELSGSGRIQAVTTTNALALTIAFV